MNKMTFPSRWISSITFFKRSSNSPRYFVPATKEPISSIIKRFLAMSAGTSPATIFCAKPSAIAVLPTPGSPIKTGLFFVRRDKIWMTRLTSAERPTTGSMRWSRACCVKSRANESSVGVPSCACWLPRRPPRPSFLRAVSLIPSLRKITRRISPGFASNEIKIRDDKIESSANNANKMCSVPTRPCCMLRASSPAICNTSPAFGEYGK